jgi:hypothetical protein
MHGMTAHSPAIPAAARSSSPLGERWLLLGAPLVAVLGGLSAEWLDFRALRVSLLLMVGFGVLATSYALSGTRRGPRPFATSVLAGAATWATAEALYCALHVALGHRFDADAFGSSQPVQAVGLIAAHGLFLGAPTGIAAALMLHAPAWRRARRRG